MRYFLRWLFSVLLNMYYKISIKNLKIGFCARIKRGSSFEGYNKISDKAYFSGKLGYASYVGENSVVIGLIGRYCSIAANVTFLDATHPIECFVSTHPAFYSLKKQVGMTFTDEQRFNERPTLLGEKCSIIVGNDVYIGFGATLIGPVRVGDGAVIAANSTVTHDVTPYSIVGGTPAKLIKMRFDEQTVDKLERVKWWDMEPAWLKENNLLFVEINNFMDIMKKEGRMA